MKKTFMITFSSILALALNTSEIKATPSFLEEMRKECETNRIKIAEEVNRLKKTGKISDSTFVKINEELKKIEAISRASERPIQMSKVPLIGNAMNNVFGSNTALCKTSIGKIKKLMEQKESKTEIAKIGDSDIRNSPWDRMHQECGRNSHSAFANATSMKLQGRLSDETFNRMLKDLGGREAIMNLAFHTSTSDLKKNLAASTAESNAKKCRDAIDKVNELLNGIKKSAHERSMKEFDAMRLEISEKVSRFKKEGKISDETFNIIVKKIEHLTEESRRSYGPGFLSAHKGTFEEIDEILKTESANPGGDKTPCARPIFINTIDGAFTCLGLSPNASWDEVDGTYNKLLKSEPYHSLSETGKKQRLKKLGKAYKILKFQKFNLGPKYRGDF